MIIKTDGSYYIMVCEKCGAEIRKHKSYCTRYGETYHFNPELKCGHCGFSSKFAYNTWLSSIPSPEGRKEKEAPALVEGLSDSYHGTPESTLTAVLHQNAFHGPKGKTSCFEPIPKGTDSKTEIIQEIHSVLEELKAEKKLDEAAKIILLTNFGIIEATLGKGGDREASQPFSKKWSVRNEYLAKLENKVKPSHPLINDLLTLFDAKITPFSTPAHAVTIEILNLFSDQIVGFTFGEYQ